MGRLIGALIVGLAVAAGWPPLGRASSGDGAQSLEDAFKKGNSAYAAGQFSAAVTHYEAARGEGLRHWVLHYNLGNAYYKSGQSGRAIASYLRAFRLKSNQRDVVYNLNLVSTKAGDPFLPGETLAGVFWQIFYVLPVNVLTALASLVFITVCALGIGLLLKRRRASMEAVVCALVLLAALGGWCAARVALVERPEGVIVSAAAEVRSAPTLTATANFTLPEGRRVLVLEEQEPIQGWLEIGVPQEGLKGWIPEISVDQI